MKLKHNADFGGWATRSDVLCSDGRIIGKGAFDEYDGKTVPLIWNHKHDSVDNCLGHALLEVRDKGVYAYGFFNDTSQGKDAKEAVKNGDVSALSIFANQLVHNRNVVVHGDLVEVSLVLAGANPDAFIDTISDNIRLAHSDDFDENMINDSATIYMGKYCELMHSDDSQPEKSKYVITYDEELSHSDESSDESEDENDKKDDSPSVKDIWDSMTAEQQELCKDLAQKTAVDAIMELISKDTDKE